MVFPITGTGNACTTLRLAAAALEADAIVEIEGKEPHWSESAQGILRRESVG